MLSIIDAELLVKTPLGRDGASGSLAVVAHIMRELAPQFSASADLWEVVGLCHDLDYGSKNDGGFTAALGGATVWVRSARSRQP